MENDLNETLNTGDQKSLAGNQEDLTIKIPVIEEQLFVEKKLVETGKIRISKTVSEQVEPLRIVLKHDEFDVERRTINQYVEALPPAIRHEGDTMIFSILREELVVQKKIVLVEEVRVTKRQSENEETRHVNLRREDIKVERLGPDIK